LHVNVIALSLFVLFVAGVHFTLSYIQNDYFLCKSMNEIRATGTYTCHVPPTSHARSGGYTGRERGGWTDGRDGWTDGRTDGCMDGWMVTISQVHAGAGLMDRIWAGYGSMSTHLFRNIDW
jgi:hypothetical protein